MAGDWIKIRIDLSDDPNVFILSDILGLEVPTVVGHLALFWGWMDRHTPDGKQLFLSETVIDKKIGVSGFASALRSVGWLAGENMDLSIPNFERHNGNSAKARALESEAKRLRRNEKNGKYSDENSIKPTPKETVKKPVRQVSDKIGEKCPTREEKRREDINIKSKIINNNSTHEKSADDTADENNSENQAGDLAEFDISRFTPSAGEITYCERLELDAPFAEILAEFRVYHADNGSIKNSSAWSRSLLGWVQRRILPPVAGAAR